MVDSRIIGLSGGSLTTSVAASRRKNWRNITPRAIAYSNFSLCGVCLVYVNDPVGTRRTLGFNWPSRSEGQAAHATILELMRTGAITPFIGRDLSFDEIPEALGAMERRETVGRLVAHLP